MEVKGLIISVCYYDLQNKYIKTMNCIPSKKRDVGLIKALL